MKKRLCFLLIISILTSFTSIISANQQQISVEQVYYKIILNGEEKQIKNPIVSFKERTYLPLRELAELLNLYVVWDDENRTIKISDIGITYDGASDNEHFSETEKNLSADVVDFKVKMNGYVKELKQPLFVIRHRTYLPLREIAELLDLKVDWIDVNKTISINTKRKESSEKEKLLLRFSKDGRWGYMDENGTVIIPPIYIWLEEFSEGLAAAVNEEYYYGYIDIEGNTVIPHKYHVAGKFSEGLTYVAERDFEIDEENSDVAMSILTENRDTTYYYIDKTGKKVIEEEFLSVGEFHDGIAPVSLQTRNSVYINKQGKHIADFKQTSIGVFHDSYALVDNEKKIINTNFEIVFDGREYESFVLKNNFVIAKKNGKWGIVDLNNNIIVDFKYNELIVYPNQELLQGAFITVKKDEKYGVIDLNGNVIIDFKYDKLSTCSEGLFAFTMESGSGYLDINENVVIAPIFKNVDIFLNGMAIVNFQKEANNKGYTIDIINKKGECIKTDIKFKEDWVSYDYYGGIIEVIGHENRYYINSNGEIIKPKL